jgi:DNA invertase Pin-like site-specific DNA recombinase
MRLLGYIRVSQVRGREGDSFISPDVQRDRITAVAKAGGHTIIEWIDDLDEPGSKYARPGFQRALELVESGAVNGIAVARLDRFSRSVADAAKALERVEAAGGVLLAADLGMDTSTTSGKLMRNVLMALAEFELGRIRDSWKDATGKAIARGVYISGKVPVGYARGDDGRLVIEPRAAEAVRSVFRSRAENKSWRTICEQLDRELPEEAPWTPQRLQWIVKNRAYLGEARQGDVTNPDAHEPLVTRVEFEAAQSNGERPAWRGEPRLLAGVARCGSCGYGLRKDYTRADFARYSCSGRRAGAVCEHPVTIGADRLEEYVTDAFLARLDAEPVVLEGEPLDESLAEAVGALEAAEAELAAFRSTNLVTVLGEAAFTAGITERAEAVSAASSRVAELRQHDAAIPVTAGLIDEWGNLTVPERRSAVAAGIQAVLVHPSSRGSRRPVGDRVDLIWRGDLLPALPGLPD